MESKGREIIAAIRKDQMIVKFSLRLPFFFFFVLTEVAKLVKIELLHNWVPFSIFFHFIQDVIFLSYFKV